MNPDEWLQMGGGKCDSDCSSCAASEWSLGKKLGQNVTDAVFLEHWKTWSGEILGIWGMVLTLLPA